MLLPWNRRCPDLGESTLGGVDDPVLRIKSKESILKKFRVIRRARPCRKGFLAAGVLYTIERLGARIFRT